MAGAGRFEAADGIEACAPDVVLEELDAFVVVVVFGGAGAFFD